MRSSVQRTSDGLVLEPQLAPEVDREPGDDEVPRRLVAHGRVEPLVAALLEVGGVDGVVDVPERVHVPPPDLDTLLVHAADPTTALDARPNRRFNRRATMRHPKDRSGLTRRKLLRSAAGGALGLSAAGILAGCENTTEPIGASGGGLSGPASKLVVPKPLGPGGLPLPRPDNAVTWAITDDNPPIKDGRPVESGPLNIYNYADYLDPATLKRFQKQFGVSVEDRHLQLLGRGNRQAFGRGRRVRRDHRPDRLGHRAT